MTIELTVLELIEADKIEFKLLGLQSLVMHRSRMLRLVLGVPFINLLLLLLQEFKHFLIEGIFRFFLQYHRLFVLSGQVHIDCFG